ncbi:TIGR03086 family metal-binding protein [Actinokineospora sp. NBRC 105648]|uniref:TIGR03086 family metal-binding protein n=1 Tax=Actinokineospora sp. NBRC 105648 TaxID=3032206 RepID=UPI0024A4B029|nr:TIGR03086 family metal-binding protein [Actinokineospora sp. NBRC 105648]GLZ37235.1 TIGR03086 family protein [Actinokineospora sp. NBRC 105648]
MLHAAHDEFRRRLVHLTPDNSTAPTPCPAWTARDLANHVVAGDRMAVALFEGATTETAIDILTSEWLHDDPIAAFTTAADALHHAAAAPGALDRVVAHPSGPIPGRTLIGFRIGEHLVHAWDLARALHTDDTLDPTLVQGMWEFMHPLAATISELGIFGTGPSGTLGPDSPLQDRLLDLVGRRP